MNTVANKLATARHRLILCQHEAVAHTNPHVNPSGRLGTHFRPIFTQQNSDTNYKVQTCSREIWVSDPGNGPIGLVSEFVFFCGMYVSGTPIRTRIGHKSILGHPSQKQILKYARILLV